MCPYNMVLSFRVILGSIREKDLEGGGAQIFRTKLTLSVKFPGKLKIHFLASRGSTIKSLCCLYFRKSDLTSVKAHVAQVSRH